MSHGASSPALALRHQAHMRHAIVHAIDAQARSPGRLCPPAAWARSASSRSLRTWATVNPDRPPKSQVGTGGGCSVLAARSADCTRAGLSCWIAAVAVCMHPLPLPSPGTGVSGMHDGCMCAGVRFVLLPGRQGGVDQPTASGQPIGSFVLGLDVALAILLHADASPAALRVPAAPQAAAPSSLMSSA